MRRANDKHGGPDAWRRCSYRRLAVWAAVLSLVVQALLPLADARHHAASGGLSLASLGGDAGYANGKTAPSDKHHGPAADHDCTLCKGIQLLGFGLAPAPVAAVAVAVIYLQVAPIWSDRSSPAISYRTSQPRAPPSLT